MSLLTKRLLAFILAIPTFGYGFLSHPPIKNPVLPAVSPLVEDTQRSIDFAAGIGKAIQDNPTIQPALAKKIKAIIDSPDSVRRTVVLRILERHARAHLSEGHYAAGNVEAIDWSKVDWAAILGVLIKILVLILPLL